MLISRCPIRPITVLWFLCFVCFSYIIFYRHPELSRVDKEYQKIVGFWHRASKISPDADIFITPTATARSAVKEMSHRHTLSEHTSTRTHEAESPRPTPEDKIIVIGKLQSESTDWVQEHLPDWQNAVYTVDNTSASLHTPLNKGREANVYLLYIIEHYDKLPSTIAFLHSHRDGWPGAWHTDAVDNDNVAAMKRLRLDFVQKNGYVNLRCKWDPGCPHEIQLLRNSGDHDPETVEYGIAQAWRHFFGESSIVPKVIATPCCAQFAVSREQVLARPLDEYKLYHEWLMKTPLSDDTSGRVFEYLWHIIFGKDPVYCPATWACYLDVYGRD